MELPLNNDTADGTSVSYTDPAMGATDETNTAPGASPTDEEDVGDAGDEDVWRSFEQSVAYVRSLSELYKDAFLTTSKANATAAHISAAKGHASEAIELLASNLLNAASTLVAAMENQDERLAAVNTKLECVKRCLKEREDTQDEETVRGFFNRRRDSKSNTEVEEPRTSTQETLSLTLGPGRPLGSHGSTPTSSYLYL